MSTSAPSLWQRFKSLFPRRPEVVIPPPLDASSHQVLQGAVLAATDMKHAVITPWHVMLALLTDDSVVEAVSQVGDLHTLKAVTMMELQREGQARLKPGKKPQLQDLTLLNRGLVMAWSQKRRFTSVMHLLASVVLHPSVQTVLLSHDVNTAALALWNRHGADFPRPEPGVGDEEEVLLTLHNDDLTTQPFVETVLEDIMQLPKAQARALMMTVHEQGEAPLGIMTAQEARLRAEVIMTRARKEGFPLLCSYRRVTPLQAGGAP